VTRFWKRDRESRDLEAMLRSSRPEPSDDLLAGIADRIRADRPSRRVGRLRVAFAAGLSVAILTALASVGGLGYAAAGAERAAEAAKKVVVAQNKGGKPAAQNNASKNQYKTTICHRTGSATNPFVEITVSNNALPAHQAHGDIIPAPPGGCPQ
jgi:hypothetical protein